MCIRDRVSTAPLEVSTALLEVSTAALELRAAPLEVGTAVLARPRPAPNTLEHLDRPGPAVLACIQYASPSKWKRNQQELLDRPYAYVYAYAHARVYAYAYAYVYACV